MADFVVKISSDYEGATVEAQFMNPSDLTYKEELLDTNDLQFTLDINDEQIASIIEYKKVALYSVANNVDTLLWTGYISDPSNDFEKVYVVCSDEKRYMQKKQIYTDKNWSATPIATILNTLVTEANARSGGLHGNLSYQTGLTDTITKDFKKGTNYFDILQELAERLNAEWKVTENEIIFETTIGEDKTSGSNFVEFSSDRDIGIGNTIASYLSKRNGNHIATAVIGKDGTAYSEQDDNTATFGFVESSVSFNDGDLVAQTTEYLNERKVSQTEITLTIDPNAIDYANMNIGDLVHIRINHGSPLIDIETDVLILEKTVEIRNKQAIASVIVGTAKKRILTPQNYLAKIDKRMKTLELK